MPSPTSTLIRSGVDRRPSQAARRQPRLLSIDQAATLSGKKRGDLVALIADRERVIAERGKAATSSIPAPVGLIDGQPAWNDDDFRLWCLRTGCYTLGHEGRQVIGYAGISVWLRLGEQSLRKLTWEREIHIEKEGAARPDDIPPPVAHLDEFGPLVVALFDRDEIRRWAMQTGRLDRDGTPIRRHPRRGANKPKST